MKFIGLVLSTLMAAPLLANPFPKKKLPSDKDVMSKLVANNFICVEDDRPADGSLTVFEFGIGDDNYIVNIITKFDGLAGDGFEEHLESHSIDFWNGVCASTSVPGSYAAHCTRPREAGETINSYVQLKDVSELSVWVGNPIHEVKRELIEIRVAGQDLPKGFSSLTFLKSDCGYL